MGRRLQTCVLAATLVSSIGLGAGTRVDMAFAEGGRTNASAVEPTLSIGASPLLGVLSGQILAVQGTGYLANAQYVLSECYFEMFDGVILACGGPQMTVVTDATGNFAAHFSARLTIPVPSNVLSSPADCTEGVIGDTQCALVAFIDDPVGQYVPMAEFQGTQRTLGVTSRYQAAELALIDAARVHLNAGWQRSDIQEIAVWPIVYLLGLAGVVLPVPSSPLGTRITTQWPAGNLELMTDVATTQHMTPGQFQKQTTLLYSYLILLS